MKVKLGKQDKAVNGGRYVKGETRRHGRAIAWASHVDGYTARLIFEEVDGFKLSRPIVVYGHTCSIGAVDSLQFIQVDGAFDGLEFRAPPKRAKGPMPTVEYDGEVMSLLSRKTIVPDLASMKRIDALLWLCRNTRARGYSRATNPLAGFGGALSLKVQR